ncbi:response regulator [Sorangium cellulosum]|uniref:LuxR family transcriptional regulator n=1 Tax=Sorangium cellulosum TaxID=56 RepID=A0A150QET4_SORCE|nr:response regulator transcription factor [Sorangium cellulosum]KYF66505.1 LuxR family transcriptional regulator [Sorangium cellulosum]
MTKLRIFLVDDHPIVRDGLKALIEAQPDMTVVGEAADGLSAVEAVTQVEPDIVLMDISMPKLGGAEATARIKKARPAVQVVALTGYEDKTNVQPVLQAGASGYVIKLARAADLVRAIHAVAEGGVYLDPSMAAHVLSSVAGRAIGDAGAGTDLSERESEVIRMVAEGHAIKEIAARLDLSARTVETYKVRAMEKLGLKSRADTVRYALQQGWLRSG